MELEQQRMDMMASKDFLDKLVLMRSDGIIGVNRQKSMIIFNAAAFADRWPLKMAYMGRKLQPVTMSIGVAQLVQGEKIGV